MTIYCGTCVMPSGAPCLFPLDAPKTTGVGDILSPIVISESSIKQTQARVAASAQQADNAVRSCTALDDATRASWGVFYIAVMDYTRAEPGFTSAPSLVDRGAAYEKELFAWQKKLQAICPNVMAYEPTDPSQTNIDYLKYGAIFIGAIGGLVLITNLTKLIPSFKSNPVKRKIMASGLRPGDRVGWADNRSDWLGTVTKVWIKRVDNVSTEVARVRWDKSNFEGFVRSTKLLRRV